MSPHLRSRRQEIHPDYTGPRVGGTPETRSEQRVAPAQQTPSKLRSGWTQLGPDCRETTELSRAACECIDLLTEGRALIEALADEDYAFPSEGSAWASPGAHTRHFLDFVDCLLTGIDAQRIDYTARKRRGHVEVSRVAGCTEIGRAIEGLQRIQHLDGRLLLEVRSEPEQGWTCTTLSRELQFVSGHVVHHQALIRMTLAHRGIEAPPEYGVAASTRAYRNAQNGGND